MDKFKHKEIELAEGIMALTLDHSDYTLTVVPQLGGKITSLKKKKTKREFLSRTRVEYRTRTYGDLYENYECDGIDECFPSVGASAYPSYPWQGVSVPDHGEVWSLPWEWEIKQNKLRMWVRGVRFPYIFERSLTFETLARQKTPYIRLSYKVTNESPYDFPFLYAFHPVFKAEARSKILLPQGTNVVTHWSTDDRLGPPMYEHDWPNVTDVTLDKSYDRATLRSGRTKEAEKLFTTPMEQGRCALLYPNKEFVGFLFPAKRLPHLGIWINEGGWNKLHHIALEPSTSQVDRIDTAEGLKRCGVVPAGGEVEWDISLITGKGDELSSLLGKF
jgi:galactose mutarotase-like enzyme